MKSGFRHAVLIGIFGAFGTLATSGVIAASDKHTLTGTVSDAMCGAQHMTGSPEECTRTCVGRGSKYMLVIGDKVYALNTTDKAILAVLDKQAGKNATVTGTVNGVGVDVSSAVAAK
jgi:hypothetical protein